ncbi:MAG: hypothetical protein KME42_02555 [Tildeniella nuda ZEHNDER 1965/U140]|jgi:hypothetical protein|nr:hypothetical protein [Tildeniella nuda ZEHNDER 1965/U140]
MNIQLGDILTAENGAFYRVIECKEGIVSLKRMNGYTSFSCSAAFAQAQFHSVQSTPAPCSCAI